MNSIYLKRMLFILFSLTIYKNIMKKFRKIHAKKKCIKINRIANMKHQLWSRMCLIYPIANFNQNNTTRKSLIVFPFSFPNRILVWNSSHRNHRTSFVLLFPRFEFELMRAIIQMVSKNNQFDKSLRYPIRWFFVTDFISVINLLYIIRNTFERISIKILKQKLRKIYWIIINWSLDWILLVIYKYLNNTHHEITSRNSVILMLV